MARKETTLQTASVSSAIVDGLQALADLRDEANEITDGASGTGREHTGFVQAMAENVEYLDFMEIDEVEEMSELNCTWTEYLPKKSWGKTHLSRARRCFNAIAMLTAAMNVMEAEADDRANDDAHFLEDEISSLSEIIDQAECCDWPSMRG